MSVRSLDSVGVRVGVLVRAGNLALFQSQQDIRFADASEPQGDGENL